ncbi:polysaccharide pyruvyl transferase family protein [Aliidiomarina taiwanensis]|nr:polysaccharide pyruvyl transferase family protein [Aliidiomarina taiwanensis]
MKTICFAGLVSETNLGDIAILKSTEYLYKKALPNIEKFGFKRLNIQHENVKSTLLHKLKISALEKLNIDASKVKIHKLISDSKKQYRNELGGVDLIVIVGGGLIKYKYQRFFMYLVALIEVAEELNIPVVLNSVGIEGYSKTDRRCQMLKKALNNPTVKSITTRDDINTLKNLYMLPTSSKLIGKAADSAVYSNEAYNVNKKQTDVFGIGLVRGGIFKDNERDLPPEQLAEFYYQLISEMEKRDIKYKLFTNGLKSDSELLPLIMKKLGRTKLELIEPKEDIDLVQVISSFTTVIAARLHANIISYSLNIPSVGLVWNNKLKLFGKDIGYPERFFDYKHFNVKTILDTAIQANSEGYDQKYMKEYKSSAKLNINKVINKWLAGEL